MGAGVVGTGAPDLAVAGGWGHGGRCGGHWCPGPGGSWRLGAWGQVWWAHVPRPGRQDAVGRRGVAVVGTTAPNLASRSGPEVTQRSTVSVSAGEYRAPHTVTETCGP